ncbi:hypothetical protein Tco_0096937 [Tanacetum coccineum]
MCTYLKNMEGYKLNYLKLKEFDSIQEMFDRAFKRVNTFEDFRTELVEGKEKSAGTELEQKITKKQKVEDEKETSEIKKLMEIIPDEEEVTIDAIPLAVNHMLKSFDREDLETLYKLVKAKYESTRPVEDLDLLLWNDLKIVFEPHVEDKIWRNQQDYKVLSWKLYDSCGVHFLRMQHMQIYMLVEKKYPLTPSTLTMMLEKKLMIDYESEMAYQILKFIVKQLKKIKSLLDAVRITAAQVYVNTAPMKLLLLLVNSPSLLIILEIEEVSKVPLILGRPFLYTIDAVIRVRQKQLNLEVGTERMIFHIDSAMKHSYSNDDTCFSIDVINKILEEDFDALLDEGSKILHSIEGTILEGKLLAEFDEFMAMTTDEKSKSESDIEEPPFEKNHF